MSDTSRAWPMHGLMRVTTCPVCGSKERDLLHDGLTDGVFQIAPGRWTMHQCKGCAVGYLDPCPTLATLGMAYASYYTHEENDHPIVRRLGAVRTIVHDLMNGYASAKYGVRRPNANRLGAFVLPLIPSLRSAVDVMFRHLPKPPAGGGRLLDVGSGNGGFLALAQEMGWTAEGIDMDPAAVKIGLHRGLNVRQAGVADLIGEQSETYDVITLSHVIEHVHDPIGLLGSLHRLLKPSGTLWLETPNLSSLGHVHFGPNWRGLEPPRHLLLFTPDGLRDALSAAGFNELRWRWRGMVLFSVFAASEAVARGQDAQRASRLGRPLLWEIAAELLEMCWRRRREFITVMANK